MKFRNYALLILAFVIGFTFLLAGCDNTTITVPKNVVKTDKYPNGYKYDPPVTISTIRFYGPQVKFQAGDTIDKNVWTEAYKEYLGINLKSLFTVTDFTKFDLKVTTAIATDNLPDIIPVYTTLFFRIADSGRTADLKPYYDKYLDPELKTMTEKEYGGIAYKTCFRNNQLSALTQVGGARSGPMLWIRQDWLDKYNLQWPANITETIKIAKFFVQKNPGAPNSPQTFAFPVSNYISEIGGLANAYGAYRTIWIDDGNGGLMRGENSPKWKPVLQLLQDMYTNGEIDNNFTLSNGSTIEQQMTNEQFGVVFGESTAPDGNLYNTIARNPDAVWKPDVIRDESGNPALVQVGTRIGSFYSVNKKSLYPEALMFFANVYSDLANGVGIEFRKYHDFLASDGLHYDTFWYPLVQMQYPVIDRPKDVADALKSKGLNNLTGVELGNAIAEGLKANSFPTLTGEELGILDKFRSWLLNKDPYGWRLYAIDKENGSADVDKLISQNNWTYPARDWGPETQAWIDKGPDLYNINTQLFVKTIRGDMTVEDGFNQWITYFNGNGGTAATAEINQWWQDTGKAAFPSISVLYKP